MWFVPGVAHSARKMFTSTYGVNAIFDAGVCLAGRPAAAN
jgi:hypothetical protein